MDGGGAAAAARLWAGSEVRRRWRALTVLGLLAGVTAGLAMAAIAGARRTDTAWERLRTATRAGDAIVFASQMGITDPDWDEIASKPYVEAAAGFGLVYFGDGSGIFVSTYGHWLSDVDRPRIIAGRAADPEEPTEVVLAPGPAAEGLGVGDEVPMQLVTAAQENHEVGGDPAGPEVTFRIVGITDSPFGLAAIPSNGDAYAGAAFLDHYGDGLATFSNLIVRLRDPARDLRRLEADVARAFPGRGVPVYDLVAAGKRVTTATDFERIGLLLFGAAVAATGLVIVGQALSRSVRATGGDVVAMHGVGMARPESALAVGLPHLLAVVVAVIVATTVAIALSPRFPVGMGRRLEPDRGVHVDWVVLGSGIAALLVVLVAAIAMSSWRTASASARIGRFTARRSLVASTFWRAGAPVSAVVGAGLALEAGRGRRALPTRTALLAATVGALGVIAAFTLAAGIDDAASNPDRFGAVWDVDASFTGRAPDDAFRHAESWLAADPDVAAIARVARIPLPIGDVVPPFYSFEPVRGTLDIVAIEGRRPQRSGEVLLGPDTARAVGVGVGDRITVGDGTRLTVVGLGLLPTTPHSSYDQGALILPDDFAVAVPRSEYATVQEMAGLAVPPTAAELPGVVLHYSSLAVALRDGVDVGAAVERFQGKAAGSVLIDRPPAPADQQSLRNVRPLPVLFGVFATVLAVAALAHVSSSVLRRRRGDLAVLRALGMRPGQTRACLGWQATVLATIGILIGVPLGILVGRIVWRTIAESTPMVHHAPRAMLAVALAVPVALVVANLLAALPGWRAARLRPADVLHTE